jgi:hypothetical protein
LTSLGVFFNVATDWLQEGFDEYDEDYDEYDEDYEDDE